MSRLLLDVARDSPAVADRTPSEAAMESAARHGLLGLMAHSDHARLSSAARAPYARLAARQKAMERCLRRLLERLAGAGVPATIVKGPAVARWLYRDPGLRTFTDIDLLVPADRIEAALDVIAADDQTVAIPPKTPKADKRNIPIVDESGVRFNLDLHWDLFSYTQLRGCAGHATNEGWRGAVWDPDDPLGPMWKLPASTLIAFLSAHAVLDHRFRLILFRDLAEAAAENNGVDWEVVVRFCRGHNLRSTSYVAWLMANTWVDAAIPDEVLTDLRPRTTAVRTVEQLMPRVDPVTFDGHRPHPLNLAVVLLHDEFATRLRLAAAAPTAFPDWSRRVGRAPFRRRRDAGTDVPQGARVLHLLPVDIARGAQTYAKAIREALDSEMIEHRTLTLFRSTPAALEADFSLDTPKGVGRELGFSPLALVRLRSFLRVWRPDVVVAHGGEALKYAAPVVGGSSRLVYYKIGTSGDLLRNRLRRLLHRTLARRADRIVGISEEMVAEVVELVGAGVVPTLCIPNGRDPSEFAVGQERLPGEPLRLISVGHLGPLKRPEWFIHTIAALRDSGIECEGWWVGDGPLLDQMRSRAFEAVTFLGNRDDVSDLLCSSDLFLLSSVAEGMPGVLIEAGLSSLPSVTTAVAGADAIVADGKTGMVVDIDDEPGFITATEKLAGSPELRKSMGQAARERCLQLFTLEASAEKWEELLTAVLADAGL